MIVVSSSLVLAAPAAGITGNNPVIGIDNRVTAANVAADQAAAGYPASNLANPVTSSGAGWRGTSAAEQYITVLVDSADEIDYLAVARPNFGSAAIAVSVEGRADPGDPWDELAGPVIPADDRPLIFRWEPQALYQVRLKMAAGAAAPRAAVMYLGRLIVMPRRLYVGHTPISLGRRTDIANGRSEKGAFLGRIVTGESRQSTASFANLAPSWYRTTFDPFVVQAQERPFFFAWRPESYPEEVGFAWLTADPQPSNQRPNGMMSVDLQLGGIA